MSQSGVLPFVRGIDFTRYDFQNEENHPQMLSEMQRLRWLRLNRTGITKLPTEISTLKKLEQLHVSRNKIENLDDSLSSLTCLKVLNARRNKLKNSNISNNIFTLEELAVLDFSYNEISEIPFNLDECKTILVLNLSHNKIKTIPNHLFINLTDLEYLNLSNNIIESLPPQIRRLLHLKTLILNDNPLGIYQLRQLPALASLETLHMKNTFRTLNNIPPGLDSLEHLSDLDFSCNDLPSIPDVIYKMKHLRRLNFSNNLISEISPLIDNLEELVSLNLSRNQLKSLPNSLSKLSKLKKLYVNSNKITFNGIPPGMGKLGELELFGASDNLIEILPEGLCRCGKLKKLYLNRNRLFTLPEAIHFLQLQELDVTDNPDFIMPPKPIEIQKRTNAMFYNIDFSLQHQLQLAGATSPSSAPVVRDPIARKKRLKLLKQSVNVNDGAIVLQGMRDTVGTGGSNKDRENQEVKNSLKKGKRWDEQLEKPKLDYSDFFDEDIGQLPGVVCYEIDKFLPNMVDPALNGKFYEGDCYIVLKTYLDNTNSLNWLIYFWIGTYATLDKQACAAMHAVNLRNYLGASTRTIREEQNDESDEFLDLFGSDLLYIEGARTSSGFYTVEDIEYTTRFYRIAGSHKLSIEPVPLSYKSLDPRFAYLLDDGMKLFLWNGLKCNPITRSKARLFTEKINKYERKFQAELVQVKQGEETASFWEYISGSPAGEQSEIKEHVKENEINNPIKPKLYKVGIGMGYLELPQVEVSYTGHLKRSLLDTKGVYILDCFTDVFVWIGRKSTRLVRTAALKLSSSLQEMVIRPEYALVSSILEGTESQVFKSKFEGWDDLIAVDYTRSVESVQKRGADLRKILLETELKTDLVALFGNRAVFSLSDEEGIAMMDEANEFLESMKCFVYENKRFVRLPENEFGQFYTEDSYLFVMKYWKVDDEACNDQDDQQSSNTNQEHETEAQIECKLYYWQGREAKNDGWLTFTFTMKKRFEDFEIIKLNQQQENQHFLSHFKRKFIIHKGKRKSKEVLENKNTKMFHLRRSPHHLICTRCIEIEASASNLCSEFCYIVCVPFENTEKNSNSSDGIVYVWIGSLANPDEAKIAEEIANYMYSDSYSIQILNEGEEPETFFWIGLGGKKDYDRSAEYLRYMRLFRCSNDRGYFAVSEKLVDFCQDDLSDDDIMILDNGSTVFLWVGPTSTDIEIKLAFKSAQVYIQNLRNKQPDRPRKLQLTKKGNEPIGFTKCFHAWSKHRVIPRNLEKKLVLRMKD